MTLEEIKHSGAAEKRVERMKANAKAAKDRAKQMKVQADHPSSTPTDASC